MKKKLIYPVKTHIHFIYEKKNIFVLQKCVTRENDIGWDLLKRCFKKVDNFTFVSFPRQTNYIYIYVYTHHRTVFLF